MKEHLVLLWKGGSVSPQWHIVRVFPDASLMLLCPSALFCVLTLIDNPDIILMHVEPRYGLLGSDLLLVLAALSGVC